MRAARRRISELELHLMRCRRRDESAWVMVARVSGRMRLSDLLSSLRITDSARILTTVHGKELACVFDDESLDRSALERRLVEGLPHGDVRFGWSRFPEDGAALDVLLHTARGGLLHNAVPSLEVEGE